MSNQDLIRSIRNSLSASRMSTYELATGATDPEDLSAVNLYAWNAEVSAALLAPIHICEVVMRNAVSEVLETVYGPRWPWSSTFLASLPNPTRDYNPRLDLLRASRSVGTIGKVIPELKFVFWQKMFTRRHDIRLWDPHLRAAFPNLDATKPVNDLRLEIYGDLDHVRVLRNRIAHHEPIFKRNLPEDFQKITNLIEYRCKTTSNWMLGHQQASAVISAKP